MAWETVSFDISSLTSRSASTGEPGGALNADYRTADAIAIVSTKLGKLGLVYNEDFWLFDAKHGKVTFTFREPKYATMLALELECK